MAEIISNLRCIYFILYIIELTIFMEELTLTFLG